MNVVIGAQKKRENDQRKVYVKLTLTASGCGMGDILVDDARIRLGMIPTVAEADIDLAFDPPWIHSMMSELAKLETGMLYLLAPSPLRERGGRAKRRIVARFHQALPRACPITSILSPEGGGRGLRLLAASILFSFC